MAVSTDCSAITLYCNESASEVVSSGADVIGIESLPCKISDDDESFIDSTFDSELDQMLEPRSSLQFLEHPDIVRARQDAVNWMLKVHAYYQFRPETAYLSLNYFDRLLLSQNFPHRKGWPLQLLAVACLSVAAKLEETSVPSVLDLQISEPRFFFKPTTVRKMELLVMAKLKWRLRIVTPFCFLHYFVAKVSRSSPECDRLCSVLADSSSLIINTFRVISFLDYTPSAIAAAAVLWLTNQTVDSSNLECFHKRLNKEVMKRCYNLFQNNKNKLSNSKVANGTIPHAKYYCVKKLKSTHGFPSKNVLKNN